MIVSVILVLLLAGVVFASVIAMLSSQRRRSESVGSATTPVAEPLAEPLAEPVVEPVAEPVAEPIAEPVAEPEPRPVATGSGVFISYRRQDESNFAGRLFERLLRSFDTQRIFMDVDSIDLGLDF